MRLASVLALASFLGTACGAATTASSPTPTPASTPTPAASPASATATATATAGARTWTVTSASKATVSVREQLVGVSLPSDAVLTATGATGTFTLNADGTFTGDSKISFDVSTLASDSRDRDNFVKQDTLQVRRFPKAELVPTRTSGLTLPASGQFTFTLTGKLTIHGVTKEVTFDVVANRSGGELTAKATLSPSVKFGDFGMRAPSVPFRVVSIVDEIRLVVDLAATGAAT